MSSLLRNFCCSGVLLALLPLQALADPQLEIVPARGNVRALRDTTANGSRLDQWHDRLYLGLQSLIKQADSYYVDEPDSALRIPSSPFRIGLQGEVQRHAASGTDFSPQLDVDLHLQMPNLQRKLQLFITSENVDASPDRFNNGLSNIRAGLRLTPLDFLDFDLGVRADVPPVAFASLRWQKKFDLAGWRLEPFSKAYVETKRGVGWANGVNVEHWFDQWVVRSASYANWQLDNHGTDWTQAFIVARAREVIRFGRYSDVLGGRDLARGIGFEGLASGDSNEKLQRYELSVFYKQPTAHRWLYWQVTPFVRWERDYGWHADPGIRISLDALFWDRASR
jgi:hypothetical protein